MAKNQANKRSNISLIYGNDFYLISEALKEKISSDIETSIIYADEENASDIINKITSVSLFKEKRIYKIYNLSENKDYKKILKIIEHENQKITDSLIFIEQKMLNTNSLIIKTLAKIGSVTKVQKPTERNIGLYVDKILEANNCQLTTQQKKQLIERCNLDLSTIYNNIVKLSLIGQELTDDIFNQLIKNSTENTVWDLINALFQNNNNPQKAISILQNMITNNANIQLILYMIIKQLKTIAEVKWLKQQNLNNHEILQKTKLHPYAYKQMMKFINTISTEEIKRLMNKLITLDFKFKTSNIDNELGILLIISQIFDK